VGNDPAEWTVLTEGRNKYENADTLYTWNLDGVNANNLTLRIYLMNGDEFYAEKRVFLRLDLPTPTAAPTLIPTLTPFPPTNVPPTDTLIPPTNAPPTNTFIPPSPTESLTPFPPTEIPTETPTIATP